MLSYQIFYHHTEKFLHADAVGSSLFRNNAFPGEPGYCIDFKEVRFSANNNEIHPDDPAATQKLIYPKAQTLNVVADITGKIRRGDLVRFTGRVFCLIIEEFLFAYYFSDRKHKSL